MTKKEHPMLLLSKAFIAIYIFIYITCMSHPFDLRRLLFHSFLSIFLQFHFTIFPLSLNSKLYTDFVLYCVCVGKISYQLANRRAFVLQLINKVERTENLSSKRHNIWCCFSICFSFLFSLFHPILIQSRKKINTRYLHHFAVKLM